MDDLTRLQLVELTESFYRRHAVSFGETRQRPWATWPALMQIVQQNRQPNRVLDIGCGNGRFLHFLEETMTSSFEYLGTDISSAMVDLATAEFPERSFVVEPLEDTLNRSDRYDAVVLFGVMHHIPSKQHRMSVMTHLPQLLNHGGVLIVSFWEPRQAENFDRKLAQPPADLVLEDGDYLMGWQQSFDETRYCHSFEEAEVAQLVAASGLTELARIAGTGNDEQNSYSVLQRRMD